MEYQSNIYNIVEAELVEFVKNNAVKQITIVQAPSKKFRIVINLTWKDGVFLLVSYRKRIREWASLDTLVRYLRENYKNVPLPIILSLTPFDSDGEIESASSITKDDSD